MTNIAIIGGGYAGFYTAFTLEKALRRNEATITLIDPLPYMTYQPFLPEVAAGSIEARHVVVPHRRHLKRTRVITARVTGINHDARQLTVTPEVGENFFVDYDHVVITAGAVTRTFPIPGVADVAIGMKTIEEAIAVRDRIIDNMHIAASMPPGPARDRLLTVVVVGGGFAGIEAFAELRDLVSDLLKRFPELTVDDTHFHLIEAMDRIMPEVSLKTSHWVLKNLERRQAHVPLNTQLSSAVGGRLELSTGQVLETDLVVWTAGVQAKSMLGASGVPLEERGRIRAQADLRVVNDNGVVDGHRWRRGRLLCAKRAARGPPRKAHRQKHCRGASRGDSEGLHSHQPRRRGRAWNWSRRAPSGTDCRHRIPRVACSSRLPRSSHADVGTKSSRGG